MQDLEQRGSMAKKKATRFVFCTLPPTEKGSKAIVYIGTRSDWERRGCLSDCYTEDEERRVDELCEKYKLINLMESTYESLTTTPKRLNKLIAQEPDFAYDTEFAAFIKSSSN